MTDPRATPGSADPNDTAPDTGRTVRRLFAGVAHGYDLANRINSAFLDRRWRRCLLEAIDPQPGWTILDLACGTGELTLALARTVGPRGAVVGLDICPEMLRIARAKHAAVQSRHARRIAPFPARPISVTRQTTPVSHPFAPITWRLADAADIPLPDAACDAVTCAFGLRNMTDRLPAVLAQIRRVLRSAGRFGILEFSLPANRLLRIGELAWLATAVPLIGTLATGRPGAYRYLGRTIRRWHRTVDLSAMLETASFTDITARPISGGIVTLHTARRSP